MAQWSWALGQKLKGSWFKPCCGHWMSCVVPIDKAMYLHCLGLPS